MLVLPQELPLWAEESFGQEKPQKIPFKKRCKIFLEFLCDKETLQVLGIFACLLGLVIALLVGFYIPLISKIFHALF